MQERKKDRPTHECQNYGNQSVLLQKNNELKFTRKIAWNLDQEDIKKT